MRTFTIAAWRIRAVWLLKKYNLTYGAFVLWNCCTFSWQMWAFKCSKGEVFEVN
jgi:hypothetical protein